MASVDQIGIVRICSSEISFSVVLKMCQLIFPKKTKKRKQESDFVGEV